MLIFFSQFKSPIVWLLVFAASLSFYFGDKLDGMAILAVLFINAIIGFYMEFQAERSMNALKKLSAVPAKVLRDKQLEEINAEDIVPGDVIYIEAGEIALMVHSAEQAATPKYCFPDTNSGRKEIENCRAMSR